MFPCTLLSYNSQVNQSLALLFLLVVPMFAVALGVFVNRASTPKMLSIVLGLFILNEHLNFGRMATAQKSALAFLAVCIISWFFAADQWVGFAGSYKAPYYGVFGVALVVAVYLSSTEIDTDLALRYLEIAGVAVALFSVVQYFAQSSLIGIPLQGGRAAGFRGSPVMLGASLVPCFLAAWHRGNGWYFLILVGMMAAQAKGAILASVVGIWVYETRGALRWSGVLAAWFGVHGAVYFAQDANNRERVELIRISWESFKQRPIWGWGPDNYLVALIENRTPAFDALVGRRGGQASAHWDLAQVASTLGVYGVVAYLWLLWDLVRSKWVDAIAPALLAAMFIQAQVNPIPTDVLVVIAVVLGSARVSGTQELASIPRWAAPMLAGMGLAIAAKDLLR